MTKEILVVASALGCVLLGATAHAAGQTTSVAQAQSGLAALGMKPGPVDGIAGPLTRAAVARFQAASGLHANGELDAKTRQALDEVIASASAVPDDTESHPLERPLVDEKTDGDREQVIELYSSAQVESEKVRIGAVELLGKIPTDRAFAALRVILYTDTMPSVRISAAKVLGDYGDLDSLDALVMALDTERDATVRAEVQHEIDRNLPVELSPAYRAVASN